jgi:hypothetical protein
MKVRKNRMNKISKEEANILIRLSKQSRKPNWINTIERMFSRKRKYNADNFVVINPGFQDKDQPMFQYFIDWQKEG